MANIHSTMRYNNQGNINANEYGAEHQLHEYKE
jgi:hypothetical protein